MKLYILRHGAAESFYNAIDDQQRALTPYGEVEVQRQAVFVPKADIQLAWVSPYRRTQQTAALLALNCPTKTIDLLTPESSLPGLLDQLISLTDDTILITHQPLASKLVSALSDRAISTCPMDTASLAILEGDIVARGCMDLKCIHHSSGSSTL